MSYARFALRPVFGLSQSTAWAIIHDLIHRESPHSSASAVA